LNLRENEPAVQVDDDRRRMRSDRAMHIPRKIGRGFDPSMRAHSSPSEWRRDWTVSRPSIHLVGFAADSPLEGASGLAMPIARSELYAG